jgi:hypothetical protein
MCQRDVFEEALPADRKGKVRVLCAYGHMHTQRCDGTDASGNCDTVMTGGGGGCCGPQINLGGFTSVALDDEGGFVTDVSSDDVRMQSGGCVWAEAQVEPFWAPPMWALCVCVCVCAVWFGWLFCAVVLTESHPVPFLTLPTTTFQQQLQQQIQIPFHLSTTDLGLIAAAAALAAVGMVHAVWNGKKKRRIARERMMSEPLLRHDYNTEVG